MAAIHLASNSREIFALGSSGNFSKTWPKPGVTWKLYPAKCNKVQHLILMNETICFFFHWIMIWMILVASFVSFCFYTDVPHKTRPSHPSPVWDGLRQRSLPETFHKVVPKLLREGWRNACAPDQRVMSWGLSRPRNHTLQTSWSLTAIQHISILSIKYSASPIEQNRFLACQMPRLLTATRLQQTSPFHS